MLLISCGLPWLVSVPSLSRMICGCCAVGGGASGGGGGELANEVDAVGERNLLASARASRRDGRARVAGGVEGAAGHGDSGDSRVGGAKLGDSLVVKSVEVGKLRDGEVVRARRSGHKATVDGGGGVAWRVGVGGVRRAGR